MVFLCIDGDCINAFGNHVRLRVPSRCIGIAAIATVAHRLASTPQSTHHRTTLSHPEKCHAKCGKALWASKMATALPSLPFAAFCRLFSQAKHLIFRHFLSYNYAIAKGRLLRARRQLGSSSCPRSAVHVHKAWVTVATLRTADPNKCETS